MSFEPIYITRRSALRAGAGAAAVLGVGAGQVAAAGGASATSIDPTDTSFIMSCDDWGARPPAFPLSTRTGSTRRIVVHHMAFPNTMDFSMEAAIACAERVQHIHMDLNGWSDTGNHFSISRGGYVMEGRHGSLDALEDGGYQIVSAHAVGQNTQSIGIENEGTYIDELPTGKLWWSLVKLCTTICTQYGFGAQNITGHWDWNNTQCPGAKFYSTFPLLRLHVAKRLGQDPASIPARTWPDTFTSCAGATVRTLQHLLNTQGFNLKADGAFGSGTLAAVRAFQTAHGFPTASDGTMTGPTWEALAPEIGMGDTGSAVLAVQSILASKLYDLKVSGTFDRQTWVAVAKLQALHGIRVTGRVDLSTWCAALGGVVEENFRGLKGQAGLESTATAEDSLVLPDFEALPPVVVPEGVVAADAVETQFEEVPVDQDVQFTATSARRWAPSSAGSRSTWATTVFSPTS
ncbi:N-acetylmuramoyl-L-alanine amidase, partial [Streptomyces sp. NPDC051940]|uniref:peptidoglycan recognition protein family protein n=1 Tax=Streptomyces sp. NPDC051940 TaxID=3155675 RepID=UPI0034232905